MRRRRTPYEADILRARLVREGYPLPDLTLEENERYWVSLVSHRRRAHLRQLLDMTDTQIDAEVARVRTQRLLAGRR